MKNLFLTIQFLFIITLLHAQSGHDSLRYLVVFNEGTPQSVIEQIRLEHEAEELWVSPYSDVRYWQSSGYPHYVNNDLISDIKEEVKRMKGRAEVTGSGVDYSVFNIGEPIGFNTPEVNPCFNAFKNTSMASQQSTIVSILDTGLSPYGFYPPEFTFSYGTPTGYNYIENNTDLSDEHGHGTHIAGIISHVSQHLDFNYLNQSDIKFDVRKVFTEQGVANISDIVFAFDEAVIMGAKVINMSFAYYGEKSILKPDPLEHSILKAAEDEVLVVCAAGNENVNNDIAPFPAYPASYTCDNILSVGSVDCIAGLSVFSNYGRETVDVTYLGEFIPGPSPNGIIVAKTGTSQATAVVSGIAAAATSYLLAPDYSKVKCAILNTVNFNQGLSDLILSSGVANAKEAATTQALNSCLRFNNIDFRNSTIATEAQMDWTISPNPVQNEGILKIVSPKAGQYKVQIFTMDGRLSLFSTIDCKVGDNKIYLDEFTHLNKGAYIMKVSNDNISESKMFVKM